MLSTSSRSYIVLFITSSLTGIIVKTLYVLLTSKPLKSLLDRLEPISLFLSGLKLNNITPSFSLKVPDSSIIPGIINSSVTSFS